MSRKTIEIQVIVSPSYIKADNLYFYSLKEMQGECEKNVMHCSLKMLSLPYMLVRLYCCDVYL